MAMISHTQTANSTVLSPACSSRAVKLREYMVLQSSRESSKMNLSMWSTQCAVCLACASVVVWSIRMRHSSTSRLGHPSLSWTTWMWCSVEWSRVWSSSRSISISWSWWTNGQPTFRSRSAVLECSRLDWMVY